MGAFCEALFVKLRPLGLLIVTAASDLLVHKILLNSVLLSPIVSGGVRPNPPGQTPLGHNPTYLLPFVGGSDRVRSTGSVLRQQKTGVMAKGYDQGGCLLSGA